MFKSPAQAPLTLHSHSPLLFIAMSRSRIRFNLALLSCTLLLGACERLGLPDAAKTEAQAEADGKAIGSACRHAGRAIEDCFTLNPNAHRAAVFAGWKEMNDYMAENKIAEVAPQIPPPPPPSAAKPSKKKAAKAEEADSKHGDEKEADNTASKAEPAAAPAEEEAPRKRRH